MAELLEQVKSFVDGFTIDVLEIAVEVGLVGHGAGLGLHLLRGGGRNRRGCDQREEGNLQETIHGDR